ncbi:hypothetical protein Pse7367_3565 [Thalassoporum mexicanum PCC 7367]|uniref:thylakoid membrane photosystem I accumulation factor n=1 Tax=Thalassoporum mexicanum TaxID=3457544 RepID=UPI00029FE709|nr:thylakoid membrane photosystem I accumulation factor [Pseudanabaena sp. PCC 7367]AFY71800.1 hypothetical protein Pse7367_3565 [Pseudanabaena sp. PCC 7367]
MNKWLTLLLCAVLTLTIAIAGPASASLQDDHYDGNIFALYGGNGSLVPPRSNLAQSLRIDRPAMLVFYLDDSSDCKLYTPVINQVQAFYGRAITIIPVAVDSLNLDRDNYAPTDEANYYRGLVPQTVLIAGNGDVLLDQAGILAYDAIDQPLRQYFDLPAPSPDDPQFRNPYETQINEFNP